MQEDSDVRATAIRRLLAAALVLGTILALAADEDGSRNLWISVAGFCVACLAARLVVARQERGDCGWLVYGVLWHLAAVQVAHLIRSAA
ncbi:MAG TPA: hypothetical protein VED40_00960 [Azospirillaceae bacterium]|nr:hypothetical protein [Azospirillaceae bacterium]